MKNILKNRKRIFSVLLVIIVIGFVLGFVGLTQAQTSSSASEVTISQSDQDIPESIVMFLSFLITPLITFFGKILLLFVQILVPLAGYNGFVDSQAVAIGWVVVRDISNIFFVIAMLMIAIGTLFNIQTYEYKQLLPKLILAAILVNFSKMIVGVFIDIGQVIMMTFVNAFDDLAAGAVVSGFGLQHMLALRDVLTDSDVEITQYSIFSALILALIMLVIASIVILSLVVILLFRAIMLWVLIILSPLAFVASALPNGPLNKVGIFGQFWGYLSKYIITGPILAFFLWLSFGIMAVINTETEGMIIDVSLKQSAGEELTQYEQEFFASKISGPQPLFNYMTTVALLIGALVITQQMGVMGGSAGMNMLNTVKNKASQWSKKAAMLPLKGAWGLTKFGERKFYKATGSSLFNPARLYKRYKAASELQKQKDEIEGVRKAGEKAEELFRSGETQYAAMTMALGSPEDFVQYYTGWHGLKRLGRTMFGKEQGGEEALVKMKKDVAKLEPQRLALQGANEIDLTKEGKDAIVEAQKNKWIDQEVGKYDADSRKGKIFYNDKNGVVVEEDIMDSKHARSLAIRELSSNVQDWNDKSVVSDGEKDRMINEKLEEYANMAGGVTEGENDLGELEGVVQLDDKSIRKIIEKQLDKDDNLMEQFKAVADRSPDNYTKDKGLENIIKQLKKAEEEKTRMDNGGLSNEQLEKKKDDLRKVKTRIYEIMEEKRHLSPGDTRMASLESLRQQLVNKRAELTKQINGTGLTDEDKEKNLNINKAKIENLDESIAKLKGVKDFSEGKLQDGQGRIIKSADEIKEELNRVMNEQKKIQARVAVMPRAMNARNQYRLLESEALKNLPSDSMEASEVVSMLDDAIRKKDKPLIGVLLKKAAQDYNDNEFLNYYGETSDSEGMKNFMDNVLVGKAGMSREMAMNLVNEIAYINEDKGHYETSRLVNVEKGMMRFNTETEHAAAVATELLKQNTRGFLQNTNRLGWGGETADGKYKMSLAGKLTLIGMQDDIIYRIPRGEFNQSALQKIVNEQLDEIKKLEDLGLITAKADGKKLSDILIKKKKELDNRGGFAMNYGALKDSADLIKSL